MIKLFSAGLPGTDGHEDVSIFDHWAESVGVNPRQNRIQEVVREVVKPDFIWVFSGSFCPPTYGHLRLAERAAEIFPRLYVICSHDAEKKDRWFTMEECKMLWESYAIPKRRNLRFLTLKEFIKEEKNPAQVVVIRGIRNDSDWEREKQVAWLNHKQFGISRYFYFISENEFGDVSSSRVRAMAENFEIENLHRLVSPLVISALLGKVMRIQNLFLVVGKPGAGKSTFLRMLEEMDPGNHWINTDKITHNLKAQLEKRYGGENLIKVVLERGEEIHEVIGRPWLEALKRELKKASGRKNVFVEIPYGLEKNKQLFRFVGGKVVYLGCNLRENKKRNEERGTPELAPFVEQIPDIAESRRIAKENHLSLITVDTNGSLDDLRRRAADLNSRIGK